MPDKPLTERLRASPTSDIMREAADYIDAQEAEIVWLREALNLALEVWAQKARAALSGESNG